MDTGWLSRLGHSPEPQYLILFGWFLAGSPAACEWYLNQLKALPNPTRLQERLRMAVHAIRERSNSRNWPFEEGTEAQWLDLLRKSVSADVYLMMGAEGVLVMLGCYFSLFEKSPRRFRKCCEETSDLPEIVQGVLSALPVLEEQHSIGAPKPVVPRVSLVKTALLAACAVVVFGGCVAWREYVNAQGWRPYATSVGQRRTVELPDGSGADLNTATRLKYQDSPEHRIVELSAGEARFRPAPDARRKFVVLAGTWAILDVGTDYLVRLHDDGRVEVAVFDGEVLMSRRIHQGPVQRAIEGPAVRYEKSGFSVQAGQMVVPRQGGQSLQWMSPEEIERRDGWREGKLIFLNATLVEIVAELNRYGRRQFVIVDSSIAGVRLGGVFGHDEIPRLLKGLRYSGVQYRTIGKGDDVRFELFREPGRRRRTADEEALSRHRKNRVAVQPGSAASCRRTSASGRLPPMPSHFRRHFARQVSMSVLVVAFSALAVSSRGGRTAELLPPRLYEVTTETGMPHLEENLRYSVTYEKRCLRENDLATAFPALTHPSLASCRLAPETRTPDRISYALTCSAGHGTTGQALWDLSEHQITGTLYVKLGGKNMTFYQRLIAKPGDGFRLRQSPVCLMPSEKEYPYA